MNLSGPKEAEPYLARMYGKSWAEDAVIVPRHHKPSHSHVIKKKISGIFATAKLPKEPLLDRTDGLEDKVKSALAN